MLALEKINWSKRKLARVAQVLVDNAMSSEESCVEDTEDGLKKTVGYAIKKLPWESERFTKAKHVLDEKYLAKLPQRSKDRLLPRHVAEERSTRSVPDDFPKWAQIR